VAVVTGCGLALQTLPQRGKLQLTFPGSTDVSRWHSHFPERDMPRFGPTGDGGEVPVPWVEEEKPQTFPISLDSPQWWLQERRAWLGAGRCKLLFLHLGCLRLSRAAQTLGCSAPRGEAALRGRRGSTHGTCRAVLGRRPCTSLESRPPPYHMRRPHSPSWAPSPPLAASAAGQHTPPSPRSSSYSHPHHPGCCSPPKTWQDLTSYVAHLLNLLGGWREGGRRPASPDCRGPEGWCYKVSQHPWSLPQSHTTHEYSGMAGHSVGSWAPSLRGAGSPGQQEVGSTPIPAAKCPVPFAAGTIQSSLRVTHGSAQCRGEMLLPTLSTT